MRYKKYGWIVLAFCLLLAGCSKTQEKETEQKDKTISEISIPGLLEYYVDEAGEYYYYTVSGDTNIYKCKMDGTPVAQFPVMADENEPQTHEMAGESPEDVVNLTGLCAYGNTLYCLRSRKGTLLSVNVETGQDTLLAKPDIRSIIKMEAGAHSVLILTFGANGKVLLVYHTDTGVMEQVPIENPLMFAHAEEDIYWINMQEEEGDYSFLEYHADTGTMEDEYKSNFTYEMSEMTYDKEMKLLYGRIYSMQYLCLDPREPKNVSRFTAKQIYWSPVYFQSAGGRLYIMDPDEGTVYHFDPAAYVTRNEPLKGYITSEFSVTEWAGCNIDLEVISWEELALKVLAEDRDYDFVIMTTEMPEAAALRDAMAYLPIPEDVINNYWAECWPCVKQGATHNGDIWMLPLEVYARGLIYSEQNLAKYGMSMENIKTMPDLCEAAKTLHANGENGWYQLQPMQDYLLQEYLWKQQKEETINFDTAEFRGIMEFIREEYKDNDYSSNYYRNSVINLVSWEPYDATSPLSRTEQMAAGRRRQAAKVYFNETNAYGDIYIDYIGAEGIRVCAVPGMSGTGETVQVSGKFLVLNPNSENKEELLEFVTAMSEHYIADPDNFLSSDEGRYVQDAVMQDVCGLYRRGEMVFDMPNDLFSSYSLYVRGADSDPDEVVKELNRVVNMYYGE